MWIWWCCVAAAGPADHLRALHRLGIDDRRRRGGRAPSRGPDPVTQVIVHPLRRSVCLPFVRPPVHGARGREVGRQRPPHRSVMGEVADGIDDVSHAPAGRAAAVPGQPRRGRQQRFAHRPFRLAHVRGVPAGTGTAREPARAAPARHSTGDSGWVDITDGGRVERHAGLLASRWLRHPSGYQGLW